MCFGYVVDLIHVYKFFTVCRFYGRERNGNEDACVTIALGFVLNALELPCPFHGKERKGKGRSRRFVGQIGRLTHAMDAEIPHG